MGREGFFMILLIMLEINSQISICKNLNGLEKKYDAQFKVVFEAIRELMIPPETKKRPIGFLVEESHISYEVSKRLKKQRKQ